MKAQDFYISMDEIISDLSASSIQKERNKKSDLFYILFYMNIMMRDSEIRLEEDPKFRELHLKHPLMRNLAQEYLGLDRTKYLGF